CTAHGDRRRTGFLLASVRAVRAPAPRSCRGTRRPPALGLRQAEAGGRVAAGADRAGRRRGTSGAGVPRLERRLDREPGQLLRLDRSAIVAPRAVRAPGGGG